DPQPPERIVIDPESKRAVMENGAVDTLLLQQREAFLRPKSLVAIVVLTDENDCSVMDGGNYYNNAGVGYLAVDPSRSLPIATAACDTNPNDECCFSCLQKGSAPSGCSVAECEGDPQIPAQDNR